jgi:hypothetical protein
MIASRKMGETFAGISAKCLYQGMKGLSGMGHSEVTNGSRRKAQGAMGSTHGWFLWFTEPFT